MVRHTMAAIAAGLVMLTSQSVVAADGITYDYDAIYDKVRDIQAKLQPLSDVHPVVTISSDVCGVKLSDVVLELRGGPPPARKIATDALGQVAFPMDPTLYRHGYSLVSDQARGLTYDVKMRIAVDSVELLNRSLAQLEADFRQGLRSVGGFIAYHVMIPQGLVFVYADGSPSAVISSPKGARTVIAQPAAGYHALPVGTSIIKLPLDQQPGDQIAKISLQRLPDSVDVMFAPDIEQRVAEQEASDAGSCKSR